MSVAALSVRLLWFGAINVSISDRKSIGRPRSPCNKLNEESVRNAILGSPQISAVKSASVL